MEQSVDAKWIKGLNSLLEPSLLGQGEYQWGQNIDHAGGMISTRQGFSSIGQTVNRLPAAEPKGMAVFRDKNGRFSIVIAIGSQLYASYYPFSTDFQLIGNGFYSNDSVVFCKAFKSLQLNADGTTTPINPYPILVMQNGVEKPIYWDGATLKTANPSQSLAQPEIPVGKWMQWSGNRLWVASNNLLHASNLGDPIKFTEENLIAGGGALFFEDTITGMNQTYTLQTLLVSTGFDTSLVQSTIYDRTQWGSTPGFQRIAFPGIGCAAGKSFVRHWGAVWWYAHGGLVLMDQAIQTYRTSRMRFRDQEMIRSKSNLADDISGICTGIFGNYMLVSVPSGDAHNAHTWVLNQRTVDIGIDPFYGDPSEWSSNWTGIKPVEYVTAVINGKQRLFCLSREDGDASQSVYPNVWELFTGERQDRFNYHTYSPTCLFESRMIGFSEDLKVFSHAEIDIAELVGMATITVSVASRRGGYHQILSKKLVSSEGSINANATASYVKNTTAPFGPTDTKLMVSTSGALAPPSTINILGNVIKYTSIAPGYFTVTPGQVTTTIPAGTQVTQPQFHYLNPQITKTDFRSWAPQRRILKTCKWDIQGTDCPSCPVESPYQDNVDRGFSLLLQWTGRLAITGIRIFWNKYELDQPDQFRIEADELNSQYVDISGCGTTVPSVIEVPTIDTGRTKSQYLRNITPRHTDVLGYAPMPPAGQV